MEVENGGLEDDFSLLLGAIFHFHGAWLWEEGYATWMSQEVSKWLVSGL